MLGTRICNKEQHPRQRAYVTEALATLASSILRHMTEASCAHGACSACPGPAAPGLTFPLPQARYRLASAPVSQDVQVQPQTVPAEPPRPRCHHGSPPSCSRGHGHQHRPHCHHQGVDPSTARLARALRRGGGGPGWGNRAAEASPTLALHRPSRGHTPKAWWHPGGRHPDI